MKLNEKDNKRFWSKVEKTDECWNWIAGGAWGYGYFWLNGKNRRANRLSWVMEYGEIPGGQQVCHTCDNRLCVNPKHFFLGTMKENMEDKMQKNRQARGSMVFGAKLDDDKARYIRQLRKDTGISYPKMSKMFGLNEKTLWSLINNLTWKHVV